MRYRFSVHTVILALAAAGGTLALAAGMQARSVAAVPAATNVAQAPRVPRGVYLGVFCNTIGKGATQEQKEECTEQLEREWGRPAAVQISYFSYSNLTQDKFLNDPIIQGDYKNHRIPLVSQTCGTSLSDYRPGGKAQQSVDNALTALKAYPGPVIFTWFHEFDGCLRGETNTCRGNNDFPGCFSQGSRADKAAQFKAAWAFIASERARLGATNVALGWRPTNNLKLAEFYPGDSQVDWILPDVYDRKGVGFAAAISPIYNAYCTSSFTSKPCGLAEFGHPGCSAYGQAQFIKEIENVLPTQFPNMHLLAWFNAQTNPRFDWKFDSCGGSQAAAGLARNPDFVEHP